MKDLLKNLREHLSTMIEEIDSYTHADSDDIIIYKKNFKHIKHQGKLNSYVHVFEYKEGIKFTLRVSPSYSYDFKIYKDFTNGSLDLLILNKLEEEYKNDGQIINYTLEEAVNTKLRNLYSPIKDEQDKNDDNNTQ